MIRPQRHRDANGRDVKLQADTEAESIVLDVLRKTSDYPVLAEEGGMSGAPSGSGPFWIVDPLDGTLNYSRNIDLCCVSIALYDGLVPILGVVYDFNRHDLFSGVVGAGADLNGEPISPTSVTEPGRAVLATGFPVQRDFGSTALQSFMSQVQQFKKIRLLGSAALSLAYVASGRVDAYTEEDIMIWDVAAGVALVQASGGNVVLKETGSRAWAMVVRASGSPGLFSGKVRPEMS
jgi:myo-inositol-1(or 4)-monophosphatase